MKKMRKIIYILIAVFFLGCTKSINIEYGEMIQQENSSLIGTWDGELFCSSCESDRYRYTLVINSHTNNIAEGTLKETKIPEQQDYILFNVKINIDNNTLEITTTDVIEEVTSKTGVYWCKENTYVLQLSSSKKTLNGEWISSGNCSVFNDSNTIKINKQ